MRKGGRMTEYPVHHRDCHVSVSREHWLAVTDELQALRRRVIELERIADGMTAGKNKIKKEV